MLINHRFVNMDSVPVFHYYILNFLVMCYVMVSATKHTSQLSVDTISSNNIPQQKYVVFAKLIKTSTGAVQLLYRITYELIRP